MPAKPKKKPSNPCFSSGPCAKRPGWSVDALKDAALGRSHRSKLGKAKLQEVLDRSRALLGIPEDYHIAIVPASDTGAMEMAMWSMLGRRGVDMLAWESFGEDWVTDAAKQLKLEDLRIFRAEYGALPDLSKVDTQARDIVFTWNGTTSGVKMPNADWISDTHEGVIICDATSAVFAMDIPWEKLDVITYSWQKAMGGEAAHGILILSPRAVRRLENYTLSWPMPKIFRLTKKGAFNEAIFQASTINTPSMLCVEDALDGLKWAESIGGLKTLIARSDANLAALASWADNTPWVDFLAEDAAARSNTSICFKITDPWYQSLSAEEQAAGAKKIASLLEEEGVAYDIAAYRDAPPGLRIWGGATVETDDIILLTDWLDWAFEQIKEKAQAA